jgi:hypothetical protein
MTRSSFLPLPLVALLVLLAAGCERDKGGPAAPKPVATEKAEPEKAEDAKGAVMPAASCAVLVYDNSEMGDEDAGHQVSGFPSFEVAKEYARRRVRASLEEVRTPGIAAEGLRRQWELFGESAQVVGGVAGEAYSGRDELDFFIAHPATDEERDWQAVARQAGAR